MRSASRRRLLLLAAGLAAAGLLGAGLYLALRPGRPLVRYRLEDRNVTVGQVTEWTFDADAAGGPPPLAEVWSGAWEVRPEADAPTPPNALCQSGSADFPALALSDRVYVDMEVIVRFKPISGREDQAAGIIFRAQDRDNYYVVRANALEDNVNFYVFGSGRRNKLNGGDAKVASGRWQELRLEVVGNRFRAYLEGQLVAEATDDSYSAGRVGLWTKTDSVTCFDNVRVTAR